jgi:uncharacterized C2H2 Zn-finger protein
MIPTRDQATPTLDRFTTLTATTLRGKPPGIDPGVCGYIRTAITHHLDLARNHPSQPDGYPTRASGADLGSGGGTGDVELTSVESAVVARIRWKDEHDTLTDYAWQYIQLAVHNLAAAEQALRKLDGLSTPPEGLGLEDDRWCRNHERHGYTNEPRARDGSTNCRWCSTIMREQGDLPNHVLLDHHHRFGRMTDVVMRMQFPDFRIEARAS